VVAVLVVVADRAGPVAVGTGAGPVGGRLVDSAGRAGPVAGRVEAVVAPDVQWGPGQGRRR